MGSGLPSQAKHSVGAEDCQAGKVYSEIKSARTDYVKRSKQHYNATMAAAANGRAKLPRVKDRG